MAELLTLLAEFVLKSISLDQQFVHLPLQLHDLLPLARNISRKLLLLNEEVAAFLADHGLKHLDLALGVLHRLLELLLLLAVLLSQLVEVVDELLAA